MKKRPVITFVLGLILFVLLTAENGGCNLFSQTQDDKDEQTVEDQQSIYAKAQPIHMYPWSQMRESLIQIYDQLVEPHVTYSAMFLPGIARPVYECPSLGVPTPADTQLTNPWAVDEYNDVTIAQAEPGGVFTSANTNATYVLCIRQNGEISVVTSEPLVMSFGHGVVWMGDHYEDVASSETTFEVKVDPNHPIQGLDAYNLPATTGQ